MSTTVKISQLPSASHTDITPTSDVLPIVDGNTTKQITVQNLLIAAGTAISGNLVPVPSSNSDTSSFSLGSESSAWKDIYVSDGTIFLQKGDGTRSTFNKQDVDDLKGGKSLNKGGSQLVNELDSSTFVRMNSSGRAWHYASNKALIKLQTSSFDLGDTSIPMTIEASSLVITGSTVTSGSCEYTGSFDVDTLGGGFNINNLLDLLANFGQTGIATGSAATGSEGGVGSGDINIDGQVNISDLLLLLAGYGNPNCIIQNMTIPQNINYQMVGPEICVSQSISLTVCNNSFFSIT